MNNSQFVKISRRKAAAIATYVDDVAPQMVVQKTLRFIDGNFRAQGWQGATFKRWDITNRQQALIDAHKASGKTTKLKGSILIKTGRLRRGTNYTTNGRGEVRFYNNVPYAKVHNEGLVINTTVHVRAFSRNRWVTDEVSAPRARKQKFQKRIESTHQVKAHTRVMKTQMPQRQFMPYEGHGSPVLENAIKRDLEKNIKGILEG